MDLVIAAYALLFAGVFALEVGSLNPDPDDSAPSDSPDRSPLYDPDNHDAEVTGTEGDDTLSGGATGNAAFFGEGGDDSITGTTGADYAEAGTGDDTLAMGEGNDLVLAGAGNDSVEAGTGFDTIFAEAGDDAISGASGDDMMTGGLGNDTLLGGGMTDMLYGDDGDDLLSGQNLTPGTDARALGIDGADSLFGGAGNDTLLTGPGDAATGGLGDDLFQLDQTGDSFDAVTRITDFGPGDRIEVLYTPTPDEQGNPTQPVVTIRSGAAGTVGIIALDGIDVAEVAGGANLTVADLVLRGVPQ